jgi:hypothetical protein
MKNGEILSPRYDSLLRSMPLALLLASVFGALAMVLQRVGFVGPYNAEREAPFAQADNFNEPAERLSDRTFRASVQISF